jgi:hypothetical protein
MPALPLHTTRTITATSTNAATILPTTMGDDLAFLHQLLPLLPDESVFGVHPSMDLPLSS